MKSEYHSAPESLRPRPPLVSASRRPPTQATPYSVRTAAPGLTGSERADLAKNQWIPLAATAAFLLLTAVCFSVAGGFAVRLAEPTSTPIIVATTSAQPSPAPPTVTVMPSQTLAPPSPEPALLRVLPGVANVRVAPSTTARIIGQIKKGSLAKPIARSEDERWILVVSLDAGTTGWVAGELFETISGDPKLLPTVVPVPP